ncbi:hypothetical protein NEFER03_0709 [Nematocida sp. LUAm3]|nr:hypothetical protein NEFER03_0709 [Nematocida sp. LUAm3]KAI5175168.1 hypothetical protein NEFER02_1129 [Nematocida sp. LUAm2]KAI5178160.1 hypothetical protein NEFER01_1338 [Nematocida sp. LUAm1]
MRHSTQYASRPAPFPTPLPVQPTPQPVEQLAQSAIEQSVERNGERVGERVVAHSPFCLSVITEEFRKEGISVDLYKVSSAIAACIIPWNVYLFFSFYSTTLLISLFLEAFSSSLFITTGIRVLPILGIVTDALINKYPIKLSLIPIPIILLSHTLYSLGYPLRKEDISILLCTSLFSISLIIGAYHVPYGKMIHMHIEELECIKYLLTSYLSLLLFLSYQLVYLFLIINKKSGKYLKALSFIFLLVTGILLFVAFHKISDLLLRIDKSFPAKWRSRSIGQKSSSDRSMGIRIVQEDLHKSRG